MKYILLFLLPLLFCLGCRNIPNSQTIIYSEKCERIDGVPHNAFEAYEFEHKGVKYIVVRGGGIAITPMVSGVESTPNHHVFYPKGN